jgi:pimeloyl-ACP methyl ester carboxylesterase
MKRGLTVCMLLFVASNFQFCDRVRTDSSPPATRQQDFGPSHYIRRTNADTVIVFVHGIFGGSIGTWTNSQTGAYWPNLLLDDPTFNAADVYVYSYASPYLGPSYTIDELFENMRLILDNDEVFQRHKRVVFLCHSMGGLIVRGYLKRYQAHAPQVPLIYFFSTPTAGSHITQLTHFLSKNPQLKGMLPARAGDFVTELQHDWRALPTPVNSRCAYETLDTYGIRIVDEQSASALCDGPVDPVDRNHIDIVKPRDKNDVSYVAFKQAYEASQQSSTTDGTGLTFGTVQTARSVDVECGQVRDDTALIPPPIDLKPQQKILDAVASLQQASNLKEQQVEAKGIDHESAKVHYHLVGLDRPADGACPAKGYGVILVSFIVSQPAQLLTAGFTPLENDKLFLALAGKSGTLALTNVHNIESIDAMHPVPARDTLVFRNQLAVKQMEGGFTAFYGAPPKH